jgi:CrcB protein
MSDHPLRTLEAIVLIGIGGFAGSNLRFFVARVLPGAGGTLAVNVVGSFVLGFILYEAYYSGIFTERARLVLTTGFLSSLTTYSTFALQTALLDSPEWMLANVLTTYALGFSGVLAGRALARRVDGGTR